jgi:hypothetical protein
MVISNHTLASAGGSEVGNGGGYVRCNDSLNAPLSVDYWEMVYLYNYEPVIFDSELSHKEIVPLLLGEIPWQWSKLRGVLERSYEFYMDNVIFSYDLELPDTEDDLAIAALPRNCQVGVVASFVLGPDSFFINPYVFAAMNETNKAMILTHEIIYYALKKSDASFTPALVRRLTAQLFQQNMNLYKSALAELDKLLN